MARTHSLLSCQHSSVFQESRDVVIVTINKHYTCLQSSDLCTGDILLGVTDRLPLPGDRIAEDPGLAIWPCGR